VQQYRVRDRGGVVMGGGGGTSIDKLRVIK